MMLAEAEVIAAREQPPGDNIISPWKIVKSLSLFETDIYCIHSGSLGY